jgi:phosphatidylinositol alpha-1,6-mannosyltransferase
MYHPGHEAAVENSFGSRSLILLTVGRLDERKGHDSVIRSVHRLRDKYPGLVYVIAGDGGYLNPLKQMVANLNLEERVRFLGAVDDKELASLYQKCDIFVLANRAVGRDSEGFGIVLLEAQATAKPVITGSDGGTGDAMIPEVTGFRVNCQDPENPAELAQAIDLLLESPQLRSSMGQRGREFVLDKFDWSRVSKFANQVLSNPNM